MSTDNSKVVLDLPHLMNRDEFIQWWNAAEHQTEPTATVHQLPNIIYLGREYENTES